MADPRTFVLIGEFKDGITPALAEINDSISRLKTSFASLGTRRGSGFDTVTKSVGSLVSANKHLTTSIQEVKTAMSDTLGVMREYRQELGKAARANFAIQRSASFGATLAREWNTAEKAAVAYKKEASTATTGPRIRRNPGGGPPPTPPSGGGGGGYTPPPSGPRRGGGGYRGGIARDSSFVFGQTLGFGLSNAITGSIVQGFQIGTKIFTAPFEHIANNFAERVKDESTDIQTAGAMFAIDQRKQMNMFDNFNQAVRAQQKINYRLAESAAALPGATTEYVQMGKRVIDTLMTVFSKDVKGTSKFAEELGAKGGDKQDALATLTQRFTEKAVLLQQGSTYRGNYGVPQLLEQLIGKENVSENMFQKFAVYRDLPIFQSVFRDMEAEIGKTGAFSAERIRLVFQLLDEALPNEVIQAHKNSMAGFLEATRSAFLDPEVGLFGLGRKIQGMEMAMVDEYGNFLDKQGKIVKSWEEAEKEQISLYESITKTLTGFGLPLSELASILPRLFEPFANLINPLQNTFKVAQSFYRNFNIYTKEFEDLAKSYSDRGLKQQAGLMKRTAGARGSLLAIANLLTAFGDMSGGQFDKISQQLQTVGKDPKAEMAKIGNIASEILKTLFNSQFIEDLGFQIGLMVGGILQTVAQALGFAKEGAESSRIVKGLKTGFEAAGGITAFRDIINNFFSLLFKFLKDIFMAAPAQFAAIGAGALVFPAITSALSVALGNLIERFIDVNLGGAAAKRAGFFDRARQLYKLDKAKATSGFGGGSSKPTTRTGAPKSAAFRAIPDTRIVNPQFPQVALGMRKGVGGVTGPYRAPKVPKPKDLGKNLKIAGKGLKVQIVSVSKNAFSNAKGFLGGVPGKLGAGGMTGLKNPIGMLGKFGTALTAVTGILSGVTRFFETGDIWKSLGAVAGPIIGNILGFAIAGPLGAFIGGWIMSQTQVTDKIGEVFRQVADSMAYVGESLAATGNDLIKFVQSLTGAETETQAFQQLLAGINIILFPLTATFNALALAAGLIRIAFLEVIMWIDSTFQGGKRQKELAADYLEANRSLIRLTAAIDEQYAKISRRKGDKSVLGGKEVTWSGTEWVGADGKPVKGGKPPASATPPVPGIPNPPSSPAAAGAAAAAPKEIAQTAANTQQLNQKATTQITQAAGIRVASQQTQKNTTTANTLLGNIKSAMFAISNRMELLQSVIVQGLANVQSAITASGSLGGGMGGGFGGGIFGAGAGGQGVNKVIGIGNMLQSQGLTVAENPAFGSGRVGQHAPGSYHYSGRAIDVTGPTDKLNAAYAQLKGTNPAELLWQVPGHYDHLHVAYALGPNNGKMFTNLSAARNWEQSMVPGSVKVASITGNSREGFGETSVVNNFTITQRDGEDGEALANRVATLFYDAMNNAQSASIFG